MLYVASQHEIQLKSLRVDAKRTFPRVRRKSQFLKILARRNCPRRKRHRQLEELQNEALRVQSVDANASKRQSLRSQSQKRMKRIKKWTAMIVRWVELMLNLRISLHIIFFIPFRSRKRRSQHPSQRLRKIPRDDPSALLRQPRKRRRTRARMRSLTTSQKNLRMTSLLRSLQRRLPPHQISQQPLPIQKAPAMTT